MAVTTLRAMTPEVEALQASLDGLRAAVMKKVAGLSEADARRSTVPSGTNLAGLLQHLTFVAGTGFGQIVPGRPTTSADRSMLVDRSVPLRTLRADYRAACDASNEI